MSITGSNNSFACNPVVFANANSIVSLGTITRDGNEFTFSVGFVWKINGVTYQNTAPVVLTIAEASTGFQRIDNALLNTSNTIELQQGLESETIALKPVAPDTNIVLTSWNISETTIGDTEDPIIGTSFVKKSFSAPFISAVTGADAIIPLDPNGYSEIRLTDASLTSIAGFDLSLITGVSTAEVPYNGKPYIIRNLTGNDITIKNELDAADFPFYLSGGADLVFPNGQAIYVLYDAAGFNEIFKSWSEVDLSTKLDKVTTSGVERAYIVNPDGTNVTKPTSEFKDVLEFADFDVFPTTGESGKIYLALDTNKVYHWSGSAYIQIGNVPEVEQQLQRYWYSMTVNTLNTNLMLVNNTNSFTISGTASVVSRAGTLYYNSFAMNNYLSATANGSTCGIKNNNQGDGSFLEGFDSSFVFINNDTNINCETTVGYYSLLSAIPNIAKSAYTADFTGVGNDVGDVNLSFYCKRNTETPSYTKVDCGSSFPAHTTTDAYILRMQMSRGFNGSGRTLKMTITNIITGAVFSHTFTDSQIPASSRNIAMVVNRSNRNTGVATNIRFSKWHQTKYIY